MLCAADGPHDKDGAGWVEQLEGTRTPLLIFRCSQNVYLRAPLPVVAIGIVHLERHAGVSAVTTHRTIEGDLNCSAQRMTRENKNRLMKARSHAYVELWEYPFAGVAFPPPGLPPIVGSGGAPSFKPGQ